MEKVTKCRPIDKVIQEMFKRKPEPEPEMFLENISL